MLKIRGGRLSHNRLSNGLGISCQKSGSCETSSDQGREKRRKRVFVKGKQRLQLRERQGGEHATQVELLYYVCVCACICTVYVKSMYEESDGPLLIHISSCEILQLVIRREGEKG